MISSNTPAARPAGLVLAALFGGAAVTLGAFAAHGMKGRYEEELLRTFETGVRYQMYHALALFGCAALQAIGYRTRLAVVMFSLGILLFSGSLYGLVFSERAWSWLGPVTPLGGVAFVVGWIALMFARRPAS